MTTKKLILPAVIGLATASGVVTSAILNTTQAANADTATTTSSQSAGNSSQSAAPDPSQGGHVGSNGTKETVLTGDAASKATAAAQAAVSGATVLRVENDADGQGTYEAHMKKSDGSLVTVYMDANFKVISTESGTGPAGQKGNQSQSSSSTSTSNSQ